MSSGKNDGEGFDVSLASEKPLKSVIGRCGQGRNIEAILSCASDGLGIKVT